MVFALVRAEASAAGTGIESLPTTAIRKLAEWNLGYVITSLAVHGDYIVLGDMLRSISVVCWKADEEGGGKLENVAREHAPLWPTQVQILADGKSVLAAEV